MNIIDTAAMTDDEIVTYAHELVAKSGVPDGDPAPLIAALRNAGARERALEDAYWRDLTNGEAAEFRENTGEVNQTGPGNNEP